VADHYSKTEADTLLAAKLAKSGDTMTGALVINSPNEATGGSAIQIRQGDATTFGIDMGVSQTTGHLNISRVSSGTATHMMTLARDTGNVGVGTSSPAQELDISSTNPAVRLTDTTTSGLYHDLVSYGNDLRFSADGGDVQANTNIEFYIDGAEKMRIDSAGIVTTPYQPAFQVRGGNTSALPLQTYTLVDFNIETFDQNSDFNTTTKTFTAPVTGKYQFNVQILWGNWDSGANYYYLQLQTSNRTYYELFSGESRPGDPAYSYGHIHVLADMDEGDTVNVKIYQNQGNSQTTYDDQTIFTGHLVC
jgi:hypothetical protein